MVIAFLFTILIPFAVGVFYTFTDWTGLRYTEIVGLQNYATIFRQNDYVYSLIITVVFTLLSMLLVNVASFALALLCTSDIRVNNFCRASFFMPNMIGGLVLGYVWQFVFNQALTPFVFEKTMLSDPNLALFAIVIVFTWQYAGYIMMIYITGLQTIPEAIIEASGIDGASAARTLFKVKIPLIANTFTVCVFLTLVNSFKIFDLNFALTSGAPARIVGGRPVSSTEFLALNIYQTSIGRNLFALGQAKAVIFFILLAAVALTQVWISKKSEVEL